MCKTIYVSTELFHAMIPTMFSYFSPLTRTVKVVHTTKSRHRHDHVPCGGSVAGLWWASGGFVHSFTRGPDVWPAKLGQRRVQGGSQDDS